MKCCLLHQKLQMLNCCIVHKIKHQKNSQPHKHTSDNSRPLRRTLAPSTNSANTPNKPIDGTNIAALDEDKVYGIDATAISLAGESQEEGGSGEVLTVLEDKFVESGSEGVTEDMVRKVLPSESSDEEFYEALEEHEDDVKRTEVEVSSQTEKTEDECGKREKEGERDERKGDVLQIQDGTTTANESTTIPDSDNMSREIGAYVTDGSDHVTGVSSHVTDGSDHVTVTSGHVTDGNDHVTDDSDHVTGSNEAMGRLQLFGDLILIATGDPMYIPITQVWP